MSNNYFSLISPAKLAEASAAGAEEIRRALRKAAAIRGIAAALDGAYVTKKLEPRILAAAPGAKHVYITKPYNLAGTLQANIYYEDRRDNNDRDCIRLCPVNDRRIHAGLMLMDAERLEASARAEQENLDRLEESVTIYNVLADRYARLYGSLQGFLSNEIPYPDWRTYDRLRNAAETRQNVPA